MRLVLAPNAYDGKGLLPSCRDSDGDGDGLVLASRVDEEWVLSSSDSEVLVPASGGLQFAGFAVLVQVLSIVILPSICGFTGL